jgi:hypothetical protein
LERSERILTIDILTHTNNTGRVSQFNTSITRQVTETTTSSWSRTHTFQASYSVTTRARILFVSGQTNMSLNYTFEYNKAEERKRSVTVGTTAGAIVPVYPG